MEKIGSAWFIYEQWQVASSTVKHRHPIQQIPLYNRHFLRNRLNDSQTLITRSLCSRHFIVDTSLQKISSRSNLPETNMSKYEGQKKFMRSFSIFYFRQCFKFYEKFLFYFVYFIFEPVFGLFRAIKIKISWNFQSISTSMSFPSYKDIESTLGQG